LAQLSRRIEPATPRVTGPFAKGCGCVAPRRENAIVFSFYPYWLADPAPDPIADPDLGAARDAPPPPSLAQVNFEAVERIAFGAMRIGGDGVLRGRALWDAAAPNFIYSALKHQAAPEIAVRLKDWTEWSPDGEPGGETPSRRRCWRLRERWAFRRARAGVIARRRGSTAGF